jgi:hypothetical protein
MAKRNWKRVRSATLREAMGLCLEYSEKNRYSGYKVDSAHT